MRNLFVHPELEALGVDHDQPHIVGCRPVEDAREHCVQSNRLAGARRARDEQVGHRGQVGDVRLTMDRLAERDRQLRARAHVRVRLQELAKRDRLAAGIRNLDADRRLARNPINQYRLGLHREAQVVGQARDLAVLHAGFGLELECRDDGAGMNLRDLSFDGELAAFLLELPRGVHQLALVNLLLGLRGVEERQRGQRKRPLAARRP